MKTLTLAILLLIAQGLNAQNSGILDGKVEGNFIGGFEDFDINKKPLYVDEKRQQEADYYVKTIAELKKALSVAKPHQMIYLDGDSSFNLTYLAPLSISAGVTLFSDRGKSGKQGAYVYSNKYDTNPLFATAGNDIVISGLRLKGPDSEVVNKAEVDKIVARTKKSGNKVNLSSIQTYGIPNSKGLLISHENVTIENCEVFNWSHAAIFVERSGSAKVYHNYIHHNQRKGLGYGVMVEGYADIKANIFDYNRHAIAGSGVPGSGYSAEFNIALRNSSDQGHIFDMHGGEDRKDGTNIAGKNVSIRNNVFYVKPKRAAVKIRGVSQNQSRIEDNVIILCDSENSRSTSVQEDLNRILVKEGVGFLAKIFSNKERTRDTPPVDDLIMQVYGKGNFVSRNNTIVRD